MSTQSERLNAIRDTIASIKARLDEEVSVPRLEEAKVLLMQLCERRELFPRADFPIPEGRVDTTYLIHAEPDERYALYVNSSQPGQSSPPHDHGVAWAIVAAIEGEETHTLYQTDVDNPERAIEVAQLTVRPGVAVSMLPQGIHAIEARGTTPLLHLHLYGCVFERQARRRQFDLESGTKREFVLEDVGFVVDARS